jgi:hypothetical protein
MRFLLCPTKLEFALTFILRLSCERDLQSRNLVQHQLSNLAWISKYVLPWCEPRYAIRGLRNLKGCDQKVGVAALRLLLAQLSL